MYASKTGLLAGLIFFVATLAFAQDADSPGQPPPPAPAAQPAMPPMPGEHPQMAPMPPMPPRPGRPPMERAMGRWWNNPEMVQKLGLSTDQRKKMDDIMQQQRLKLIDLNASLQKAEAIMEPLMDAEQPDEAKIVAQIDRVAQARAELEKANARMLLALRQTLTPEQWKKWQEERPRQNPNPRPNPARR